jgi:protein TonB
VSYPVAARNKKVQGAVAVQVRLDGSGNVADAQVLSGPDELRRAALESVLQWHFAHETAGSTRQVTIAFALPKVEAPAPSGSAAAAVAPPPFPPGKKGEAPPSTLTLKSIAVVGLSDEARGEVLSRLPVHEGDTVTPGLLPKIVQALHQYDEHLNVQLRPASPGEATLTIITDANTVRTTPMASPSDPTVIRIGGNIQASKLISQPRPVYPPEAKAARIQGVVRLQAVIAADGTVKNLEVMSGHPLLVPAALEAVKGWVYETTLLNGNPVEVQTAIDINFTLSQ